jgi:creatinine amidohydrolase/Fe(II)-dependent formamide hydrolase-like protein
VAEVHFDPVRHDIARGLGVTRDGFERVAARSVEHGEWRLFQEVLEQTLWQIEALGFEAIVVLCGHYPLTEATPPVIEAFNRNHRARVAAATEAELVQEEGDHAAIWETSLGLTLFPELVRMDRLPPRPGGLIGILGPDARDATVDFGKEALDRVIRAVADTVESLLAR